MGRRGGSRWRARIPLHGEEGQGELRGIFRRESQAMVEPQRCVLSVLLHMDSNCPSWTGEEPNETGCGGIKGGGGSYRRHRMREGNPPA